MGSHKQTRHWLNASDIMCRIRGYLLSAVIARSFALSDLCRSRACYASCSAVDGVHEKTGIVIKICALKQFSISKFTI